MLAVLFFFFFVVIAFCGAVDGACAPGEPLLASVIVFPVSVPIGLRVACALAASTLPHSSATATNRVRFICFSLGVVPARLNAGSANLFLGCMRPRRS